MKGVFFLYMLLECLGGLFISFTFLYILFAILYLFKINNVNEKDMLNFYKNQWKRKNK